MCVARYSTLARRYDALAGHMAQIGEWQIEAVLRQLSRDARDWLKVFNGVDEKQDDAPSPIGMDVTPAELLSTYAVWAFAVRNEMTLFTDFASLAGDSANAERRFRLKELASLCLDRAAQFRAKRRIAYHAERQKSTSARFPDLGRIQEREDLVHVALQTETWMRRCLSVLPHQDKGWEAVRKLTDAEIERLTIEVGDDPAPRRLQKQLQRLAACKVQGDVPATAAQGRVGAEADRLFDYYDAVFEAAMDDALLAESQALSRTALARIHMLSDG